MELVINSPKDKDQSVAAESALFPIRDIRTTENDKDGPNYKELAESIKRVFADATLPTDFKVTVLKGISALMGRSIDTSESFAQMIENLESLNVRDEANRDKASKNAIFTPFESQSLENKKNISIGDKLTKAETLYSKDNRLKKTKEDMLSAQNSEEDFLSNQIEDGII